MWQTLRAEIAYSRPYLLGALGLAAAVTALVSVIFVLFGGPSPDVAAGILAIYLIMAPQIVGFIAQGHRYEDRRSRLLLAGPLTPVQIGGAMVLFPIVCLGIGIAATIVHFGVRVLLTGALAPVAVRIATYVAGLMIAGNMMSLLGQEVVAAYRQRRRGATLAGWGIFVGGVLLLSGTTAAAGFVAGPYAWPSLHAGNALVAVVAMAATLRLYVRRTDFTR